MDIFTNILTKKSETTERSLYEIEVALAKMDKFNYLRNIVAYNITGACRGVVHHECDMLVLSKSGYLTEIEIKRSWADFLADFTKAHRHKIDSDTIKYFYYCIPKHLLEDAYNELEERNINYTGIITYDENLKMIIHRCRLNNYKCYGKLINGEKYSYAEKQYDLSCRKLFLEEQLEVARLGAMRSVMLKEKIIQS